MTTPPKKLKANRLEDELHLAVKNRFELAEACDRTMTMLDNSDPPYWGDCQHLDIDPQAPVDAMREAIRARWWRDIQNWKLIVTKTDVPEVRFFFAPAPVHRVEIVWEWEPEQQARIIATANGHQYVRTVGEHDEAFGFLKAWAGGFTERHTLCLMEAGLIDD